MLGTIIALTFAIGLDDGKDNTYFATLRDPVVDVSGNLFVHYAFPESDTNLELWKAPLWLGPRDAPGTQIAKKHGNPRGIGTLPDGKLLLVLAVPPEGESASLIAFSIADGSPAYDVGLPAKEILEASLTINGQILSYVARDEDIGQADVWTVPIWKWIDEQRRIEAGEEIEDPVYPIRLSNDVLVEHHVKVSRTGGLTAWTVGHGPSVLAMAKNDGTRRFLLKETTGYVYARDFYPRDKYLLWESQDFSAQHSATLRQFGWTHVERLESMTMLYFTGYALDPLRPVLNADGTIISLTMRTTGRKFQSAHEDSSSPGVIAIADGPGFPVFHARPPQQKHMQLSADQNLSVYGVPGIESVQYSSSIVFGHGITSVPMYGSTVWHPTRPYIQYRSQGYYQRKQNADDFRYQTAVAHAFYVNPFITRRPADYLPTNYHAQLPMLRGYPYPKFGGGAN